MRMEHVGEAGTGAVRPETGLARAGVYEVVGDVDVR